MSKFVIKNDDRSQESINRTIRFQGDIFDRLEELSKANGVTFNKIVNMAVKYALENLDEERP